MIAALFSTSGRFNRLQFLTYFGIAVICEGFPALGAGDLGKKFDIADVYLILGLITAPFCWVQLCATLKRLEDLSWYRVLAAPLCLVCFWPLWNIAGNALASALQIGAGLLAAYAVTLAVLMATVPGKPEAAVALEMQPALAPKAVGVVGWVVAIDGILKGQQFQLRQHRNRIGSGANMELQLVMAGIAPADHASILFDPETVRYSVAAGSGAIAVGQNSDFLAVGESVELRPYDRIRLPETTLIFVPLYSSHHGMNVLPGER